MISEMKDGRETHTDTLKDDHANAKTREMANGPHILCRQTNKQLEWRLRNRDNLIESGPKRATGTPNDHSEY